MGCLIIRLSTNFGHTQIKKRIIVVGGSTAFGTGLQNDDETFAHHLEHLLNAEVINAAVVGHASGQELVYLLTELVDLQPDLVITLDGWNDYDLHPLTSKFGGSNGFGQIEEQLKTLKSVTDGSFLTRVSNLNWILFPNITKQLESLWVRFFRREEQKSEPDLGMASAVYATNITKMQRLSEAFNYQFLCVLQPDRDRKQQYRTFRETAKMHLQQVGIVALDLNELDEPVIKAEWYMDPVHLDGAGHQTIAQIITNKIVADRLLR